MTLSPGQTWCPFDGEEGRQIHEHRAAGVRDDPYQMGTVIVGWARSADDWGWCSERSFKAWIRRTKARLV